MTCSYCGAVKMPDASGWKEWYWANTAASFGIATYIVGGERHYSCGAECQIRDIFRLLNPTATRTPEELAALEAVVQAEMAARREGM